MPENANLFDSSEYFDNVYENMVLGLDPSIFGENNANRDPTDHVADFPFENVPTHSASSNMTPCSLASYHDRSAWMDHGLLQDLPSKQPDQVYQPYHGHIPPPTTTEPYERIPNRELDLTLPFSGDSIRASRGLPRRRSRYLIQESDRRANAVFIPPTAAPADPLERWKESPPEGEAASLLAIRDALENQPIYSKGHHGHSTYTLGDEEGFQNHRRTASRAASTTSGESDASASSRRSGRSGRSGLSNGSQTAPSQASSGIRKTQTSAGRRKRDSTNKDRIFCCTFCCDKFKSKFDWVRHEKSLHLNLEEWVCAPFGGSVVLPSTGRFHCAYCNQLDPTTEHLDQHKHGLCQKQARQFRRKDHLLQHMRLFHRLDTMPLVDDWKRIVTDVPSRCGFCEGRMSTWEERADHLTFHFRKGCTMAQWKGDHDFPPEIAAQIKHSVPPYMLDFESRSFVPFSATNRDVNDHLSQMLSRATFLDTERDSQTPPVTPEVSLQPVQESQLDSYTEVLTRHLSHYARQMMGSGVIPTDEMFQSEARRLLFDSEDQWNQTMADNLEWLAKFRGEQSSNDLSRL
ncbi:hypothetical protein N7475_010314 [Penicillium sp. IBT 31633x]|nr:hypothetical protein N7475_010314 [Penicillium sp. IBT 31633x]